MHTPTISDQTDRTRTTPALRYDGASSLTGVVLCNDIVAEFDNGMTTILQQRLSDKQPIHFMPTAVSDEAEYINGVSTYILLSEEISLSMFKTKLVKMVSNILGSTSKTWNHWDQNKALKAVHEVGISTASDNLNPTYYYRKVACEERLPLSSWATLSNYFHEYIQGGTYLFQVSVNNYNPTSEDDYNNPLFSLALSRDRTLVLTWDIETYSSLGLGKFPTAQSDESNVFMIAPDIQIGFNDSQYDWRFIVEKAKKLGIFEWMFNQMSLKPSSLEKITKWQYQYNKIKYYGKALKETNATTDEQIREVAEYCIIDAISCQQLMCRSLQKP
uniref:DNA-directed DNA polymerase family B exonuclease domain-containing protein n=1 Tax=Rhizophagus irregularis (strain DAOM 181602 / DAOM 197198 / MUCL 43194) TaxID=747089 RepID=U9TS67_RHIID